MSFLIETTVSGLDFGAFAVEQQGRSSVSVNASVTDDNRLQLTHEHYGSEKTFTVSGGGAIGINDETYAGIDVAGLINGFEGTGSGQSLNASNEDENTRGITIVASLTADELLIEGNSQGSITLISGVADRLYNTLTAFTDPVDGFVQVGIDSIELEMESLDERIDIQEQRLEQRREMYVRRFTEMEKALSLLQSMQQQLNATLGTLPQTSLISS
jgi:flagellar hook-associated protein 2